MGLASGIRAGRAFVTIALNDKLAAGLKRAQRRLRAFGTKVRSIGVGLIRFSAGIAAGFAAAVKVFARFDDRMRSVRALSGSTQEQFKTLTDEARRLGGATSFSASQVAEAMANLARAGFKSDGIINVTEDILALARATGSELPRATEIAADVMNSFGVASTEMGRVSDVLTATANNSSQSLEDLFEAMKPVGPIATAAGESMEDVAAAIGILANNGIKGSAAGNALSRAYKNLSTSAKQAELKKFGIEAVDSMGNLRPLADIIADLGDKTKGLGSAQRLSLFESLFGRGQAAALNLAKSSDAFDELLAKLRNSAGVAKKTAEEMDAGIGGAFRRLFSAIESVAISIGNSIEQPVRRAADVLQKIAGWIDKVVKKNGELARIIAKTTAIVLGVGVALVIAGTAIVAIGAVLGGLATIAAATAAAASAAIGIIGTALAAILSPIGLVVGAVAVLGIGILKWTGIGGRAISWLGDQFRELKFIFDAVVGGMADALKAGDIKLAAEILWASLRLVWKIGLLELEKAWLRTRDFFITSYLATLADIVGAFHIATSAIEAMWIKMVNALEKKWSQFKVGVKVAKGAAVAAVSLVPTEAKSLIFGNTKQIQAERGGIFMKFGKTLASAAVVLSGEIGRSDSTAKNKISKVITDLFAKFAELGIDFSDKKSDLDAGTAKRISERGDEILTLGTLIRKLLRESKELAEKQEKKKAKPDESEDGKKPPGSTPDAEGLRNAIARRGGLATGTFSAAVIDRIFGKRSVQERTAKATEATSVTAKQILNEMRDGKLAFV